MPSGRTSTSTPMARSSSRPSAPRRTAPSSSSTTAVKAGNSSRSFEIKLWENGDIDLLYDEAGTGENAGIGIENADGTDALQFSYLTDVLTSQSALSLHRGRDRPGDRHRDRRERRPADRRRRRRGARQRPVDTDGRRRHRTSSGSCRANTISRSDPMDTRRTKSRSRLRSMTCSWSTPPSAAPIASLEPTELDASVDLGESTEATVTLSNDRQRSTRLGGSRAADRRDSA